ncbi:MAG TPA: hybrid sensor histidine kinase/response regulator, partial [Holophaga sp.]|nr:hybrid sensor histidine kinase/response regulator [Holophaga sp.]
MTEERHPTVLVVDDAPDDLKLLSGLLKESYRVKIANGGEKALGIARSDPPDLVLLDILMPEMDGFEVCTALAQDERLKDIPVVFISALDDVWDKVKAFRVGGADYVTKPFQAEEVLARVDYQIELRRLRRQLEDRNRVLEEAYARLQEMDQMKASFTAMMVHDLRSPLAGIQAVLDIYEARAGIAPELLARCRHALQDVFAMLNDVMELFRSEDGEIPLNCCRLAPGVLFSRVLEAYRPRATVRGISLNLVCPDRLPELEVDPSRVNRVLSNLVDNALKYTLSGGHVLLESHEVAGEGVDLGLRWLSITVTDTGQGIPPELLPYIFDPYRQTSKHDANLGFGLGLAIVQR